MFKILITPSSQMPTSGKNNVIREHNLKFNLSHSHCSIYNRLLLHYILFGKHLLNENYY